MSIELELSEHTISPDNLTIIGITTPIEGFALAQAININLYTKLTLFKDFESYNQAKNETNRFKNYYYYHSPYRLHNFLISNKNSDDKILFQKYKKFDYIFILIGRDHKRHARNFIKTIKDIYNIVLTKTIYPTTSKIKLSQEQEEGNLNLDIFGEPITDSQTAKPAKKKRKEDEFNLTQFIEDIDFNLFNSMFEKKIFLAYPIVLNEALNRQINNLMESLSQENIRPIPKEKYHLTLEFIGTSSTRQIQNIISSTKDILKDIKDIEIEIDRIDVFETKKNNFVLWLGIKENQALIQLQKKIKSIPKEAKINIEETEFIPHISICRINNYQKGISIKEDIKSIFKIENLQLKLSCLTLFETISVDNTQRYDIIYVF